MRFVIGKRFVLAAISLAFILAACGGSSHEEGHADAGAGISQSSIAGVPLGLQRSDYERRFGRKPRQGTYTAEGWRGALPYLDWPGHRFAAFFRPAGGGAILILTWNKAYRTAAGAGPGTPLARLKAVYGNRLEGSPMVAIRAYALGRHLIFTNPEFGADVSSVALYRGLARHGVAFWIAADVARSCASAGGCS